MTKGYLFEKRGIISFFNFGVGKIFLLILIGASLFSINQVLADVPDFAGGTGTQSDPYQISNCLQLQNIGKESDSGPNRYYLYDSNYFKLTADIDCSATSISDPEDPNYNADLYNNGAGYISPGYYAYGPGLNSPWHDFGMNLDGNYHTIFNLTIHDTCAAYPHKCSQGASGADSNFAGLLGRGYGSFKNLKILNANVSGGQNVGILFGQSNYTPDVYNVSVSGAVTATSVNAGLLAGETENVGSDYKIIENVSAVGTVNGTEYVGGLIGYSYGGNWIKNSYSSSTINLSRRPNGSNFNNSEYVGGLVGYTSAETQSGAGKGLRIENSYSTGAFSNSDPDNNGVHDIGGLVGHYRSDYDYQGYFKNSFSDIPLIGWNSGGLIGAVEGYVNGALLSTDYSPLATCISGDSNGDCQIASSTNWINNSSNAPLNNWNFVTTWKTNTSTYPIFNEEQTVPDPVTNLNFTGNTLTSISISWTDPKYTGRTSLTGYDIKYSVQGANSWTTISSDAKSITINNLSGGTSYDIEVYAKNIIGSSSAATTSQNTADLPPRDVVINSCADLLLIGNDSQHKLSDNYILAHDIDCSATHISDTEDINYNSDLYNNGYGFTPIGSNDNRDFTGTFNGAGYKIDGLTINNYMTNDLGLFYSLGDDATINNLGLTNVNIWGNENVGALASYSNGTITKTYVTGQVSGSAYVGALVGESDNTIEQSYSSANVNGSDNTVGGLVGENDGEISDSYATGDVNTGEYVGSGEYVGGLIGQNYGAVISCYSIGHVSGDADFGGMIGYDDGETYILQSFWNIETSGQETSAGSEEGLTTDDLKNIDTYTIDNEWDFNNTWEMSPSRNNGYPYLNWQYPLASETWVNYRYAADNTLEQNDNHVWGVDAFHDVQSAVNRTLAGGTVHVAASTYGSDSRINIQKAINLIGPGVSDIPDSDRAIIHNFLCAQSSNAVVLSIEASNVHVSGLVLNEEDEGGYCNIAPVIRVIDGATNVVIDDNSIGGGRHGIAVQYGTASTTISHNIIHNASEMGINLASSLNNSIFNNNILSNGNGIYLTYGDGGNGQLGGTHIYQNNIYSNMEAGIYFEANNQESAVTVGPGNMISENGDGIFVNGPAYNLIINGNRIYGNTNPKSALHLEGVATGLNAQNNWWGDATGPFEEAGNPNARGDQITIDENSHFILYRPFCVTSNCSTLSNYQADPNTLSRLFDNGGTMTIPTGEEGGNYNSTNSIDVNEDTIINIPVSDSQTVITLPASTVITKSDGGSFSPADLSASNMSLTNFSGFTSNEEPVGAFQWGIPGVGLHFDPAIRINMYVGSALNGQTLTIKRSLSTSNGWTSTGIVSPTCVVSDGICSFEATSASYYSATKAISNGGGGGGGGGALVLVTPTPLIPGSKLDFVINGNTKLTNSNILSLAMNGDPKTVAGYAISLDGNFVNSSVIKYLPNTNLTLPPVNNTYTVYLKYYSTTGNASEVISHSIEYKSSPETPIIYTTPITATTTPLKITKFIFKKDLKLGMVNSDVKELQKYLNANGFTVAKSGTGAKGKEIATFGPATKNALIKFQKAKNITPASGLFGPLTRAAIK
ncbi:MAG: fibronectin type III domain-containing protein [Candidatus Falkowbacteria bacterium]